MVHTLRKLLYFFCFLLLFCVAAPAAKGQSYDSLKSLLPSSGEDYLSVLVALSQAAFDEGVGTHQSYAQLALDSATQVGDSATMIDALLLLAEGYYLENEQTKARQTWEEAIEVGESGVVPAGLAKAKLRLAQWYIARGNGAQAEPVAQAAAAYYRGIHDYTALAHCLTVLCEANHGMGKLEEAIQYCGAAMALTQDQRLFEEKVRVYGALGDIFLALGREDGAKNHFNQALSLAEQIESPTGKAHAFVDLGLQALRDDEPEVAVPLLKEAIEAYSASEDPLGSAKAHLAMGKVLLRMMKYNEAERHFSMAFSFAEEIEDADLMSEAQVNLGYCFGLDDRDQQGRRMVLEALARARTNGQPLTLKEVYYKSASFFHEVDSKDSALYFYFEYETLREQLLDEEVNVRLGDALQVYAFQVLDEERDVISNKLALEQQSKFNQQVKIWALLAGILAVGLIAGVLYSRYTVKMRATEALERQTESINRQKEEILAQRNDITRKSRQLEETNQQITQSIEYARNIQMAMLPKERELRAFFPESFILNSPRDIVSGDIFWFGRMDHKMVLALVDCTGHGVPGAFLTVLVNNLLNQLVLEQQMYNPAEIVTTLDQKVRKTLRTDDLNSSTNGLDIALMVVDSQSRWLEFTGAKMPLYYVHNYSLVQIKGDRFSVGTNQNEEKFFTRQRIKLQEGDYIYLATDGFQNQFGGRDGKKFMKTQFRRLLTSLSTLPMASQRAVLEQRFETWKGEHPQTDDVLVVGLQL